MCLTNIKILWKKPLETGLYCSYFLNQQYCRFSVLFSEDEFVFVEQFYELLGWSDQWNDFKQCYDYDNQSNCICSLYATSLTPMSVSKMGSLIKKNGCVKFYCKNISSIIIVYTKLSDFL